MGQLFWFTARAGGIVAWALLTASVIWGLWLSGRVRPLGARPAWILDLHRFLGGLATVFVGVHVASILLDSYTTIGLTDVHVASLPLFVLATIHYVAAGTDASDPASLAAIGVATSAVALLFVRRMQEVRARGGGLIPASGSPTTDPTAITVPGVAPGPAATTEDRLARLAARRSEAAARG